jgi:hypothetical protein
MLRIDIFGGFLRMGSIQQRLHTRDSLWGLYLLSHGKEFGRLGHRPNVASLFGWSLTIGAGQQIALHAVGSLILSVARCVIRLWRLLIIS